MAWKGIMIVAEVQGEGPAPVTLELLSRGRQLARKLDTSLLAVIMGTETTPAAEALAALGADQVIMVDEPELTPFTEEAHGKVLAEVIAQERPEIVLAGATDQARSFLPYTATLMETGLTANCMEVDVDPETRLLLPTRPAYGGNLMATITCPRRRPQMATVKPHVYQAADQDEGTPGKITKFSPSEDALAHKAVVTGSDQVKKEGPDLTKAEIIITAGRGVEDKETLELVKELASLIRGAVGATRPLTDEGWLPEEAQIGQTGVAVSPKLYVGCGVSGAAPHTVGIQGTDIIMAINKDREAPIFHMARFGFVADLKELLPLIIEEIKSSQRD